jgi:predicted signal transduction protein with EAL and GGDEF domain
VSPSSFALRLRERPLLPSLLVGYLAFYAVWQLTDFGPSSEQAFISNIFFWPVDLAAVYACLQAARRTARTARLSRARKHFAFVLDDFGTGYSALASLRRFPLAALKLDRLFTAAIDPDHTKTPITRAVVALGAALGLLVIAEGVETSDQLTFLRSLGCEAVQGFLLGAPQPAALVEASFAAGRRDAPVLVGG